MTLGVVGGESVLQCYAQALFYSRKPSLSLRISILIGIVSTGYKMAFGDINLDLSERLRTTETLLNGYAPLNPDRSAKLTLAMSASSGAVHVPRVCACPHARASARQSMCEKRPPRVSSTRAQVDDSHETTCCAGPVGTGGDTGAVVAPPDARVGPCAAAPR